MIGVRKQLFRFNILEIVSFKDLAYLDKRFDKP